SLLAQQPRPTLFPYTTLFRSVQGERALRRAAPHAGATERIRRLRQKADGGVEQVDADHRLSRPHSVSRREAVSAQGSSAAAAGRDRKSTRLNSSHVSISYAVF